MPPLAISSSSIPFGAPLGLAFLFLGVVLLCGIAALSHADDRAFSAAIVYLALGVCAGVVVRATGLGRLASPLGEHEVLQRVTDGALILALFSTGMRIRRGPTLSGWQTALRLIAIAMPLTILFTALWGAGPMGLSAGAAIALGAALAPTDPVLAGDLGIDPPRDEEAEAAPEPEFALTGEAGLNDGVALPFLMLAFAVAKHESLWHWAGTRLVYGVVVAVVVGAASGRALARLSTELRERGLLAHDFDRWIGLAAAFATYGVAESIGGYGFVAAFAGGVGFRRHELEADYRRDVHDGADVFKHFSELAVILLLGSMLALNGFGTAGAAGLGLAALSVFVIRPLTALASLTPTGRLTVRERLWVAWFGVRGVASLNYAAVAVAVGVFGRDTPALVWTVLATVALSVVVHGVTSTPLTRLLLEAERRRPRPDDDVDGDPTAGAGSGERSRAWTRAAAGTGPEPLPSRRE